MVAEKAQVIAQTIAQRGVAAGVQRLLHGVTVPGMIRPTIQRKHSSGQATTHYPLDRTWIEQP
jgi:hypothetical protein